MHAIFNTTISLASAWTWTWKCFIRHKTWKNSIHIVTFWIKEYFHRYIHEQNDKECQETLTKAQLYRWRKSHLWWLDDTRHITQTLPLIMVVHIRKKKLIYETSKTLRAKQLAVHLDWTDTSFCYIRPHALWAWREFPSKHVNCCYTINTCMFIRSS